MLRLRSVVGPCTRLASQGHNSNTDSLVEPVGDGYVLHHVHRVQDIAASWGHGDLDALSTTATPLFFLHLHDFRRSQLHLGAQTANLLFFDLQPFVLYNVRGSEKDNKAT